MDKRTILIAIAVLCISSVTVLKSWADKTSYVDDNSKNIVVEIDYGAVRSSRRAETPWIKGRTVLEILQTVAKVETHPVGQYVFVTSIDGVEGKRGETAWYYTLNGKSADKLAYSNILNNDVDHIQWVYKKDICSGKVDEGI